MIVIAAEFMPVWSIFSELMPFCMGHMHFLFKFGELMPIGMGSSPELVPFGMGSG